MRVLHVISSISPLRGGPSVAVRNMLEALHRRGIEADVATTDDDGDAQRLSVALDTFVGLGDQRVRYFPRQARRYLTSWPLLRWLRRSVRRYDLVHTHGLFSFAPVAAAWQARAARVPYVMRPAGVLDSWGMHNKSARVKATSIRLVEGPLLGAAAAVHFMSDLERDRAAHLRLPIHSVVLPLGFDLGAATPHEPAGLEELAAGGRPVILYLARLHKVKRVDLLLRAYARLPQRAATVLAIAGDGEASLVTELQRLAGELGVSDTVRWLGFAGGPRKQRLLAAATVFVLPSASENFGVSIVEAMHAGLPVICTSGAGLASFVRQANAGLVVEADSVPGLESAITRLLAHPALRASMGAAGRRAVEQELSLDAFGSRLESLYRSVLDGATLPGRVECFPQ